MIRGKERAARSSARAIVLGASLVAALAGCKQPAVGEPTSSAATADGARIEIAGASVTATAHLLVSFRLTRDGVPVGSLEEAAALDPQFTVAALSRHPVDGLAAWRSLLLTGSQTLAQLPPGGPGTPPALVLANVKQPGAEANGTLAGADGAFTYEFANALPASYDSTETLRVGVWLVGTETADGTSTFDFRPAGGAASSRDVVLSSRCDGCHGTVRSAHGGVGVKICLTCHTWQHADPDTVDPAQLGGATGATDPNPLELGRLIHRIHRGRNLPTLYAASSTAPAPTLPSATALPLPFFPARNALVLGQKYSVVAEKGREVVFGRIVDRVENNLPARRIATGVVFPRDLRDCGVCHGGAPQASETLYGISRRTCAGCHPETWYAAAPITDTVHFAHPGGVQADETQCRGCHVAATATQPKVYAPIAEIHVQPHHDPRFDRPVIEIVSVENLLPGAAPTVRFKLHDRLGDISPIGSPTPAYDPDPWGSPVPRSLHYLAGGFISITVNGPTAPAYGYAPLLAENPVNPVIYGLTADAQGIFTYQFVQTVPPDASGTWAVGFDARRRGNTPYYDTATDRFRWPYTGEGLSEPPVNPLVYVDTATGTYTAGAPSTAVPRRKIVTQEKCLRCHDPIEIHGTVRARVEYCLVCHTSGATDWGQRPKVAGKVNLAATLDGIEERSIEFKVMIHRIHTGGVRGAATLEGIEPFLIYGRYGTILFADEGIFPGDLANCTVCHEGKTYTVDAVPADAAPTIANETPTVMHDPSSPAHVAGEPAVPPIQSACLGCHASSATQDHARRNTIAGVEQCANCHLRGALSVDVAHGLARSDAPIVGSSFRSIAENIFVPRCASAACHGGNPPAAFPQLDAEAAYQAIVGVPSQQVSGMALVEPYEPEASYLLIKMRGEAASVGGIATPMPIGDAALDPSDLAAVEAWIANGAPND